MTSRGSLASAAGRRVLALLLGTCFIPTLPALAQAPVAAGSTHGDFKFSLGVGGGYTSNATLRSDGEGSSGDSIANLRADLSERKTSPRTDWSAAYDSYYTSYGTNDQFDSLNHSLNFDGRYLVTSRSHLNLFEHFFYSRNPLQIATTAPTTETVILTQQTHRWRSISDVAFDTSLSRSLSLLTGVTSRIERIDLNPSVDTDTYSGRLGIQKQLGKKDSIASSYSYSRFDFHDETVPNSEANGVDVSWSHGPPAGAGCTVSAGVSKVTREGNSQNLVVAGATLHHPFRRLDFISEYRRSLAADIGVATLTVAQNANAGLSGTVGRSASLGAFAEYGTRDSVLDTGAQQALRYTGGGLRGSIALNPRLSLSGEARRRKQVGLEGAVEDLTVDTFFMSLVLQVF